MKKLNFILASMAVLASMPVVATEIDFTYATNSDKYIWGTAKAENYDVAIKIQHPSFVGAKVTGLQVPVPQTSTVTDMSGWLTTTLALETVDGNRVNKPNICSVEATPANGMLTVTFAEPYTITEEGVYVGYSFKVIEAKEDMEKAPVFVTNQVTDDGFYLHTSRTYRTWKGYSATIGATSALTVVIDGDFYEYGAAVANLDELNLNSKIDNQIPVSIVNHGSKAITELGYTIALYKKGNHNNPIVSNQGSVVLDTPVAGQFNAPGKFIAELPACPEANGDYDLVITITDVNGEVNRDNGASATTPCYMLLNVPVKRPVMEEWTGTWCGWCTRGWKAMELLNKQVDGFIGIAYHNGDPMQLTTGYFCLVEGFPGAYIDRELQIDPYFGTGNSGFGSINDYLEAQKKFSPVLVALETKWEDDAKTKLNCRVITDFVKPVDSTYALTLVLVNDGLKGTSANWTQKNYYTTASAGSDPNLIEMANMGAEIKGLVFDDVAVQISGMKDIKDTTHNKDVEYNYTFNIANNSLIQDKDKLYVVVEVIETGAAYKYGKNITNAVKVKAGESEMSGVDTLVTDANVESVEYFDLAGRKALRPADGLFVKVEKMSDGSKRSSKVILK